MKTWEMIQKLCENKKRKAYSDEYDIRKNESGVESASRYCAYISKYGTLCFNEGFRIEDHISYGRYKNSLTNDIFEREWTISEPEIKRVKFVEALLKHKKSKDIVSLETQRTIYKTDDVSTIEFNETEINGLWEIIN